MKQWISAWGYQAMDYNNFPMDVENETLCVRFLNNVYGKRVKIRFSNRYSQYPLLLEKVRFVCMNKRDSWENAETRDVHLNGKSKIEIAPYEEIYSDEIEIETIPGQYFAILIYVKERQQIYTGCSCFLQDYNKVFTCKGEFMSNDFTKDAEASVKTDLTKFEEKYFSFYGATRVEIETEDEVKTIACFGDSITHQSLWTGPLTEKIYRQYPGKVTLINCGISGNRILHDESPFSEYGPWFGKAATSRFEKDIFQLSRVDLVTILLGINDIMHPLVGHAPESETVTAGELEEGLLRMIENAHTHGAKVIGCTITPWKNCSGVFNSVAEEVRTTVNEWILKNDDYDAVFDFASMIADPNNPEQMLPIYDSGDNLHPGAEGGLRIAECIDLNQIAVLLGLEGA